MAETAVAPLIDVDKIDKEESSARVLTYYNMIAPILGWVVPKGIVRFKRSKGLGAEATFLASKLTDETYNGIEGTLERPRAVKMQAGKGQLVQIKRTPRVPTVPSQFKVVINGRTVIIPYGAIGETFRDSSTGELRQSFQALPIHPKPRTALGNEEDSCIEVDPKVDFKKYAYLMLCPQCSQSPMHVAVDVQRKLGIDISFPDPSLRAQALMSPDIFDVRQDRLDEVNASDLEMLAKVNAMGSVELSSLCVAAKVSLRGNADDPVAEMKARIYDIYKNKALPVWRDKYNAVKILVEGSDSLKDYASVIKRALKLKVISHDGSVWKSHSDNKPWPWTIMDDPTSGDVAEPGKEVEWLARKIVKDDMETWFVGIERQVMDKERVVQDEVMGRGDGTLHDIALKALTRGIVVRDNKTKTLNWSIDGTIICDCPVWHEAHKIETLKKHFVDTDPETLAALVASKTATA